MRRASGDRPTLPPPGPVAGLGRHRVIILATTPRVAAFSGEFQGQWRRVSHHSIAKVAAQRGGRLRTRLPDRSGCLSRICSRRDPIIRTLTGLRRTTPVARSGGWRQHPSPRSCHRRRTHGRGKRRGATARNSLSPEGRRRVRWTCTLSSVKLFARHFDRRRASGASEAQGHHPVPRGHASSMVGIDLRAGQVFARPDEIPSLVRICLDARDPTWRGRMRSA